MKAKQCSFLLVLVSLSSFGQSTIDSSPYQKKAQAWIEQYIFQKNKLLVPSPDLQLIANLFYFSYLRSFETIKAQRASRAVLESTWNSWQNIAHTRMNPSLPMPHLIDFEQQQQQFATFAQIQKEHRRIGLTYSQIAEAAVKTHTLCSNAQEGVLEVREHARTVVAQAFLDAKKMVGDLYEIAIQGLRDPETNPSLRFDIMETISYYLPILSMQSFIEAEKAQLKTSENSWQIISIMLEVNMRIWETIEIARASYYAAHYNALAQLMNQINVEKKYWTIIVDEQGFNKSLKHCLPKSI